MFGDLPGPEQYTRPFLRNEINGRIIRHHFATGCTASSQACSTQRCGMGRRYCSQRWGRVQQKWKGKERKWLSCTALFGGEEQYRTIECGEETCVDCSSTFVSFWDITTRITLPCLRELNLCQC